MLTTIEAVLVLTGLAIALVAELWARPPFRRWLVILGALVALGAWSVPKYSGFIESRDVERRLGQTRRDLGETRKALDDTRKELGDAKAAQDRVQADLIEARQTVTALTDSQKRAEAELANARYMATTSAESEHRAEAQLSVARKELEAASLKVAELEARAARAERDVVELKQRTEPRRLSEKQRALIVSTLKKAPPGTITVTTVSDQEALGFAGDLVSVLRAAGWTVQPIMHGQILPTPYGLTLFTGGTQDVSRSSRVLLDAMKSAGLDISIGVGRAPGIEVGLKPVTR